MYEQPEPSKHVWIGPAVGTFVATGFLFFWSLFIRSGNTEQPFSFVVFENFSFDAYWFGIGIQQAIVPLALLFIFSRTPLFRRCVTRQPTTSDLSKLIVAICVILLISQVSRYTLSSIIENSVLSGFFLVFVAGLMGGWQGGLTAGVIVLFANALFDYQPWSPENTDGFQLDSYIGWFVIHNMGSMAALWVGVVSGFLRTLAGNLHRYGFVTVVGGGMLTELLYLLSAIYAEEDGSWHVYSSIQSLSIAMLSFMAFALMLRYTRDDESQHQAEEAKLELAQMNLALTQTKLALAQAELRALHAQINPHFFFNSLNTIRYFIRTDPMMARELLTKLSEIFQRALSAGEFVTLGEEITHTEAYLALEKARLDDRLTIIWSNLASDMLEFPVPTLILQPLVENAVIHGISPKNEGGTVHIIINRVGNELIMQVDDDGVGMAASRHAISEPGNHTNGSQGIKVLDPSTALIPSLQSIEKGLGVEKRERPSVGLRNVAERLRMLYGDEYQPVIEPRADKGTRVMIRIPLKKVDRVAE